MRLRHVFALVLIAAALATTAPASAGPRARSREMKWTVLHLVNDARRSHGLRALRLNADLSKTAWRHSTRMAARGTIFHTANLYDAVRRYRPSRWGENVGMAGTARRLHTLFMHSAEHRANILGASFHRVGIGLVASGGGAWGTLIFYG